MRASQFSAPYPTKNPVATPGVFISQVYNPIDNKAAFSKNKNKKWREYTHNKAEKVMQVRN